jgi:sugar lactone lactonase YvrE
MVKCDVIADYGDLCGEGPFWNQREQALYWTDITGKRFYRCAWPAREHQLIHEGFEIAGFVCHEAGGFVVVNSGGVWLWDEVKDPRLIAAEVEGKKCALNDCIADPKGRVFSGSCFYDSNRQDYPLGCLFRVNTDASVQIVDEGIKLSNGLGFSPDNRTLYLADSAARLIYAYDYRATDGNLANRRIFVRVPSTEGLPDGLTVDAQGFVWSAQWFGGCIVRYDPDGVIERRITIPASQTSSIAFGGADLTDIFVTSASLTGALPLAPPGYDPGAVYVGGKLFHFNLGIPGKAEHLARVVDIP